MLTLAGLGKTYRTDEIETRALDGISLKVGAGEFVAVMGPSGCGKSTLLNIMGCLDRPSEGSYRLLDEEIAGRPEARLAQVRRACFGFVFQNFNLIEELDVAENVEIALLYRGGRETRKTRVAEALARVGLGHRAHHRPRQLSGGEQQRTAIARALVSNPKLILADEPTGNLDTANGEAVMALLKEAAQAGTAVVMVTHSALHAAEADRTIRMLDGRIVGETRI